MIVKLTYTVVARTKQQAVLHTKQHARRHAPRNPICIGRPSNRPIPCIGRQITSKLKDSREADDEHTASEQDSGDAERNRGSKEEVFTGINARGTIAGGLGRQSTQLEQEEDEILCVGWKKHEHFASVLMWNNIGNVIEFEANSDIHCNGIPLFSALDNALYCMAIK